MNFDPAKAMLISAVTTLALLVACDARFEAEATSGVKDIDVAVATNAEGITVEQQNVRDRLLADNTPGEIKHLYVISAFSGDVLLYSTVRAKVSSSGKRLAPYQVAAGRGDYRYGIPITIGGMEHRTPEVLQDDGTYGSSIPYLFWWDAQGRYHQHYVAGGQILHVSDQPLVVGQVRINLSIEEADG